MHYIIKKYIYIIFFVRHSIDIRNIFLQDIFLYFFAGTKTDLWSTVSPKMAQRIFSGMLNESLSIIVTRFIYVILKKII